MHIYFVATDRQMDGTNAFAWSSRNKLAVSGYWGTNLSYQKYSYVWKEVDFKNQPGKEIVLEKYLTQFSLGEREKLAQFNFPVE